MSIDAPFALTACSVKVSCFTGMQLSIDNDIYAMGKVEKTFYKLV